MKLQLSWCLFFLCNIAACISLTHGELLQSLVHEAPIEEINLVYNLLYLSWERSMTTCMTQRICIDGLSTYWNSWHAHAKQRLDPSRAVLVQPAHTIQVLQHACAMQERFSSVNAAYSTIINRALHPLIPLHPVTRYCIEHIRATARIVIREALMQQLDTLKEQIQELFAAQEDTISGSGQHRHFLTSISNYIALQSFTALDETLLERSDQFFRIFIRGQELINQLWYIIESTRAEYYKQNFIQLYVHMKNLPLPDTAFQRMPLAPTMSQQTTTLLTPDIMAYSYACP